MPAIDLTKLTSPIRLAGDAHCGFRDPAAYYHDGVFYLYYSYPTIDADGVWYSQVAWSKSRDLLTWSAPLPFTPRDRMLNYGSPGCVVREGDDFVLCLQTYPTPGITDKYADDTARIWTMRSQNLEHWGAPELLRVKGPDVPIEHMGRMIDAYLLRDRDEPNKWWCFYKQNGVSLSWSYDLRIWNYVGSAQAGENACVIPDGGEYVLFSSPETGILVQRSTNLQDWRTCDLLTLGVEHWPWAQGRLSAGFVLDLRDDPRVGKALLFFHGSRYGEEDPRGGYANWVSIGLAWSADLKNWEWPKDCSEC